MQGVFVRGQAPVARTCEEAEALARNSCVNEALGIAGLYEEYAFSLKLVPQFGDLGEHQLLQVESLE